MKIKDAVQEALEAARSLLAKCEGNEQEALEEFVDSFGGEICGWEMRISELKQQADSDE